jgi:hypothetical protein
MRGNKYHVAPVAARTMDGIRFDSKAEMRRWWELQQLARVGHISDLERQPEYVLVSPFVTAGKRWSGLRYRGDFRYIEGGHVVVEDVKGVRTAEYRIKRMLMARQYPDIDFREISA